MFFKQKTNIQIEARWTGSSSMKRSSERMMNCPINDAEETGFEYILRAGLFGSHDGFQGFFPIDFRKFFNGTGIKATRI